MIGVTDLGHHLVERSTYTPYGELTVDQETGYGDRDGDGHVDSTDKGTVGTTGTVSGSCRILDLDFDGDYDSTDATKFDALTQGAMRSPGRKLSAVEQPFAHQGLLFEPEVASYQNRARQYDPGKRRFAQRDPIAHGYDDFQSLSPYLYIDSNPASFDDPLGLFSTGALAQAKLRGCTRYSDQICTEAYYDPNNHTQSAKKVNECFEVLFGWCMGHITMTAGPSPTGTGPRPLSDARAHLADGSNTITTAYFRPLQHNSAAAGLMRVAQANRMRPAHRLQPVSGYQMAVVDPSLLCFGIAAAKCSSPGPGGCPPSAQEPTIICKICIRYFYEQCMGQ